MPILAPAVDAGIMIWTGELTKSYGSAASPVYALRGVTLEVMRGERVAFLGKSGSGKSTLLNLLGGLDHATSGGLRVAGRDIDRLSRRELSRFRSATVGMIFQSFNLILSRTALENVELPMIFAGPIPSGASRPGQTGSGIGRTGATLALSAHRNERRRESARGGGARPGQPAGDRAGGRADRQP